MAKELRIYERVARAGLAERFAAFGVATCIVDQHLRRNVEGGLGLCYALDIRHIARTYTDTTGLKSTRLQGPNVDVIDNTLAKQRVYDGAPDTTAAAGHNRNLTH